MTAYPDRTWASTADFPRSWLKSP